MFIGEIFQLWEPGHGAVLGHDLADDAGGVHAHHLAEVYRGFGVTGPCQHPAGMVPQREEVAGTGEFLGFDRRVQHGQNGRGAVTSRDTGGGVHVVVHRNGERGLVFCRAVLADHQRHLELVQALSDDGHTEQAAGVGNDEINGLGCHHLGGHHQVPFVLTVLIVNHDEEPARF